MAILPIVKYPDPKLKTNCAEVKDFNPELSTLIDNMYETMYSANGIGLAAPQVGELQRVIVIDISEDGSQKFELVNPEIVTQSGKATGEEGCLSIPEYREKVTRATNIKVKAFDRRGDEFTLEAIDLLAVCLQHEIDHINGILFVDRISQLKKQFFKAWYAKNGPFIE